MYYWCGGERGRREWENISHKLDMMVHKDFIEDKVKTKKGTLSKEVTENTQGLDLGSSLWEE